MKVNNVSAPKDDVVQCGRKQLKELTIKDNFTVFHENMSVAHVQVLEDHKRVLIKCWCQMEIDI